MTGVSISPNGMYALVADYGNHLICLINISSASVTTLTGEVESFSSTNGIGNAKFNRPLGISISPMYALVGDSNNHVILLNISTASETTLVGEAVSSNSTDGIGSHSRFYLPQGLLFSPDGVYALVAHTFNHLVRQIVISASMTTFGWRSRILWFYKWNRN